VVTGTGGDRYRVYGDIMGMGENNRDAAGMGTTILACHSLNATHFFTYLHYITGKTKT